MILTTTRTAVCEKHGEFEQQVISMPFFELPVFSQCPRCIEEEEYALAEKAKDGELDESRERIEGFLGKLRDRIGEKGPGDQSADEGGETKPD